MTDIVTEVEADKNNARNNNDNDKRNDINNDSGIGKDPAALIIANTLQGTQLSRNSNNKSSNGISKAGDNKNAIRSKRKFYALRN